MVRNTMDPPPLAGSLKAQAMMRMLWPALSGQSATTGATGKEQAMGVNEFLAGLDAEQLRHVRAQAGALLLDKEYEGCRLVWQVNGLWPLQGYFAAEDYPLAVAYLSYQALHQHASVPLDETVCREVELKAIRVLESEYQAELASVIAADRVLALACIAATGNAPQQG